MSQYANAKFLTSAAKPAQFVPDQGVEVAFAGRSNAGKSSAINTLVNQKQFARTSKTPGRTQLVNFFALDEARRLVDLPGYGFAKVTRAQKQQWRTLMGAYFGSRTSLQGLFLICDIRRELTEFDAMMLEMVDIAPANIHILLTKADKLKRGPASQALANVKNEVPAATTVQLFSALKRTGLDTARARLNELLGKKNPGTKAGG